MSAVAKAVHRGANGSVHYLSSTVDGSLLIIADPAYGVVKIPLDGPCRQVPRGPNLPAGYRGVVYESVSATGSTQITVSPGRRPFEHTIGGVCSCCVLGVHDFELWPVCPRRNGPNPRDYMAPGDDGGEAVNVELYRMNPGRIVDAVEAPAQVLEAEPIPEPEPEPVRGKAPVPTAVGPTTTNLADIDGPSWGPS
jgi:hypothetical protein